jgi:hypothetical protein
MDSNAFDVLVLPACRAVLLGMVWGWLALKLIAIAELLIEWAEHPLGRARDGIGRPLRLSAGRGIRASHAHQASSSWP